MKNIINILIAAGVVVLAGIVVVVLFITGILGSGGKPAPAITEPETTRSSESPRPSASPSPTPSPSSTTPSPIAPTTTPDPTPEPAGPSIPGSGGEVRLDGAADLEFTPDRGGVWVIRTYDSGDYDPDLTIFDPGGASIAYDDDSAGDYDAIVILQLDAGTTYTIAAGLYGGSDGSFTLSAQPAETIPGDGGSVRVRGTSGFAFTPSESGVWEIRTSDDDADPYLELYDSKGSYLTSDDDGGDDYNALIRYELTAGTTYCILARNYGGVDGGFTLTVSQSTGVTGDLMLTYGGEIASYFAMEPGEGLEFTPDEDGIWVIFTSDNGDTDPMLEIYGPDHEFMEDDDDGWGDLNALLIEFLFGGDTYTIVHKTYADEYGTSTLNIKAPTEILMPGVIYIDGPMGFRFTPVVSGTYVFMTSDCEYFDPVLYILDADGDYYDDDDDGGEGYNVFLTTYLQAGETYHILLGFWDGYGVCTFSVAIG